MLNSYFTRRRMIILCSVIVTAVLSVQLVAATVWTADFANAGPGVTIVQLSQDSDSDWATNDLIERLTEFIHDDPFFTDRISVIKTSDPHIVESITDRVVIYVSHGGPIGIVTGDRLTSWRTMAEIVTESKAIMHLFTSCYSRNIIRYGDGDSGEKLYTVPGARPAEVTNVEITTTVMLALGVDVEEVEQYRTSELAAAKEWIEAGENIHIMDFEQIILDEIETIDETYTDTWTDTHRVYRYAVEDILNDASGFGELPSDIDDVLRDYFTIYWTGIDLVVLPFYSCYITYIGNYYYEAEWVVDDPIPDPDEPPEPSPDPEPIIDDPPIGPESASPFYIDAAAATEGHWEYGPHLFSGGTYSGMVTFGGDAPGQYNHFVTINITASGPTIDTNGVTEIDSLSMRSIAPMGTYMTNQKVDGVWGEPVVGRDPARTGGLWTDSAVRSDYEYVSNIPSIPYPSSTGTLSTNGEYYTITSIPGDGSDWRGPSFIQTLPSYFKLRDFGSFSANLSFIHGPNGFRKGQTCVSLYDENMQIALSLMIADDWDIETGGDKQYFSVIYYNEAGVATTCQSDIFTGDINGVVTVRYDTEIGLHWKAPGNSGQIFMTKNNLNVERLIKYVGISSYRYGWRAEHDERIYNIRLSYAASEYTVFHDNSNDMNNFYRNLDFGYGTSANGTFVSPAGESYLTLSDVEYGTGWHGPNYVHVLDRPFRLFQLNEFSVLAELVQGTSSSMGKTGVALYDDNRQCIMTVEWADDDNWGTEGWLQAKFYPQNGGEDNRLLWYGDSSILSEVRLWWEDAQDDKGKIMVHSDNSPYDLLMGGCDNASRIVQYIVVMGQGYSSNPLLDMRIHDINVEADIKRHVPSVPEPDGADGTSESAMNSLEPTPEVQSWLDSALAVVEQLISWWEGWWPRLHSMVSFASPAGGLAILHISIDLIGDLRAEETSFHSPLFDQLSEIDRDNWAQHVGQQVSESGAIKDGFRQATDLSIMIISTACSQLASAFAIGGLTAVGVVLLIALTTWQLWLFSLVFAIGLGIITVDFVFGILAAWLDSFLGVAGLVASSFVKSAITYYIITQVYTSVKNLGYFKTWLKWTIIGVLVQFFIYLVTYYIFTVLVEYSIELYLDGVST